MAAPGQGGALTAPSSRFSVEDLSPPDGVFMGPQGRRSPGGGRGPSSQNVTPCSSSPRQGDPSCTTPAASILFWHLWDCHTDLSPHPCAPGHTTWHRVSRLRAQRLPPAWAAGFSGGGGGQRLEAQHHSWHTGDSHAGLLGERTRGVSLSRDFQTFKILS